MVLFRFDGCWSFFDGFVSLKKRVERGLLLYFWPPNKRWKQGTQPPCTSRGFVLCFHAPGEILKLAREVDCDATIGGREP